MPRIQRTGSSTGIYHACIRGINQQRIFEEAEDFEQFLELVRRAKESAGVSLLAYCLMNNHAHILLSDNTEDQDEEGGVAALSRFFRILDTRYAQWFNRKYERSGHLFQNRYRSEAVQTEEYLITVIDYIHRNPVKAGICKRPEEYVWSSRYLLGKSGSLIDENRLAQLISIQDIMSLKTKPLDKEPFDDSLGRKPRFSDDEAVTLINKISSATTTTEFLALAPAQQLQAVLGLRAHNMPIRQIARLTGLSKGVVERWCKQG